ncbi:retrovirus-related pol polyprotein from transposon TNT 1-94 [Tanacetum coccineum]
MPKENKTNLKRTARISVRPCCFVNPKTSSPPYQPFSPPLDYTSGAPPTSPITTPPLSPINTTINSNENCLLTPKSTPPPLTSPPPAPTQPSKLTSPVTINLDPIELLFSTPPSSPSFLDLLGDLPPSTTNPSPPRPSFATIERLANEPPPIPPMDSTFPSPTPELEPTLPPLPLQCLPNPPSQLPPLLPLGPNNPFPLLTHEMFYEHCQRTQVLICLGVDLEPDEWIKDSGCSKHITGNRKPFSTYKAYNGGNVIFGSNLRGNIIGKGTISNDSLKIDNVEHVDNLGFNLLSIGQICDNKCRVTFFEHDSEITKDGKVIGRGIRKKGLYVMKLGNKPKDKICLATIDENSTLWHRRLGHANMRLIQSLASKELVRNLPKLNFDQHFCDACKIGNKVHVVTNLKNIVQRLDA